MLAYVLPLFFVLCSVGAFSISAAHALRGNGKKAIQQMLFGVVFMNIAGSVAIGSGFTTADLAIAFRIAIFVCASLIIFTGVRDWRFMKGQKSITANLNS